MRHPMAPPIGMSFHGIPALPTTTSCLRALPEVLQQLIALCTLLLRSTPPENSKCIESSNYCASEVKEIVLLKDVVFLDIML